MKFQTITVLEVLSNGNEVNAYNILADGIKEENEGRLIKLSQVTVESLTTDAFQNTNITLSKNGIINYRNEENEDEYK